MDTTSKKEQDSPSRPRPALMRRGGRKRVHRARVYAFHGRELLRCTTPRKLGNLLLVRSQSWLRRDHMPGMPISYIIDPINVQSASPLCPTAVESKRVPQGAWH
jgi:hypothetical protein